MRFLNYILENFFKSEDDRKKLVNVIIPSFIVQALSVLIGFGITVFLARGLGASDYGIFTYVFSIVILLVNLSTYGMNILVVREASALLAKGNLKLLKGLMKWASYIVATICIILAITVSILTYWFHILPNESYSTPMLLAAISVPFYGLLNFYAASLRGMNKIVLSLVCDSIKHTSFFIIVLAMYLFIKQMALIDMVFINTFTFIIGFMAVYILYRTSPVIGKEKPEYDTKLWWGKLGSLFLLNGLLSIDSRIDVIMLGYLKNSTQVGIFNAANKVASTLSFFLLTMNFIIAPTISKLNALDQKEQLQKMVTKTIRWVMLITLPFFIAMVLLSKWIMNFLFGADFEQGYVALIVIGGAHLMSILFGPVGNIALMTGQEKYYTIFTLCSMIIAIALNFILIPTMGYNGAAIATAGSIVFWNGAMFIRTKQKQGISSWIFG